MGFGYLDLPKILMILVVAMIVIGPDKLPRIARQMGSTLHSLQKMRARLEEEMRTAVPEVDLPKMARNPKGAVAGFVAGLATTPGATAEGTADTADGATTEAADDAEVSDPGIALPGDEIGGGDYVDHTYADSGVYAEGPEGGEQVWGESGWTSRHDAAVGAAERTGSFGGGREELVSADDPSMN
jgi:TatA/E family protein of Tat protein translocase